MNPIQRRPLTLLSAVAAAVVLAACGRDEPPPTVGQRVDQGIAQAEQKADEVRQDIAAAGQSAGQTVREAANEVADSTRDATITAKVNTELMRDDKLSAMKIDVDTTDGRVMLQGKAPDAESRERATRLVRGIEGVVAVDNRLIVDPAS